MPDKLEDLLRHRPGGGPKLSPDGWSFLLYLLPSIWMCGISAVLNSFAVITYWLLGGGTVSAIVLVGLKHYYGWVWPGVKPWRIVLGVFVILLGGAFGSLLYVLPFGDPILCLLNGICAVSAVFHGFFTLQLLNLLEIHAKEYWKHCEPASEEHEEEAETAILPKGLTRKKMVRIALGLIMAAWGVAAWTGPQALLWTVPEKCRNVEFPLCAVGDIALGRKGRMFVALNGYRRIQVYGENGYFIRGWFMKSGAGMMQLHITEDNQIHVAALRQEMTYIYNEQGEKLDQKRGIPDTVPGFDKRGPVRASRGGRRYELEWPWLNPRIVEISNGGERRTFISNPLHLWLLAMPLPTFLFMAGGLGWALYEFFTIPQTEETDS